jgi:hypothetical protein
MNTLLVIAVSLSLSLSPRIFGWVRAGAVDVRSPGLCLSNGSVDEHGFRAGRLCID